MKIIVEKLGQEEGRIVIMISCKENVFFFRGLGKMSDFDHFHIELAPCLKNFTHIYSLHLDPHGREKVREKFKWDKLTFRIISFPVCVRMYY